MNVGLTVGWSKKLPRIAKSAQPIVALLIDRTPVLAELVMLYGVGESISDILFLERVRGFIEGVEAAGGAEARTFGDEIRGDPELAQRAAKAVLLSISAISDLEKAPVLGYIYAAFLHDEINLETLRRLLNAVDQAMVDDLWALAAEPNESGEWAEDDRHRHRFAIQALRTTGLAELSDSAFLMAGKRSFIASEVTQLGQTLIGILRKTGRAGPADRPAI